MATTSTTTPAPCVCDEMPDKMTINVRSSNFSNYCKTVLPPRERGASFIFAAEDIDGVDNSHGLWIIDNEAIDIDESPFFYRQGGGLPIQKGVIPMVFRKIELTRENCPVYFSTNNSIPLRVKIHNFTINKFVSKFLILRFAAWMLRKNNKWIIIFRLIGNGDANFQPKILINEDDCPRYESWIEGNFQDIELSDLNIDDSDSDELVTIAMRIPPFKNSVLGF